MGHEKWKNKDGGEVQPFVHNVQLLGPQGEIICVWGTFDDRVMVAAMCSRVFSKVKHWLGECGESNRRLCMADGKIVKAEAVWKDPIQINNICIQGSFKVFDSGGSWSFLFRKPLMKAFDAVHYYLKDMVTIRSGRHAAMLCNQIRAAAEWQRAVNDVVYQLTNARSLETKVGGQLTAMVQPPIRQVPASAPVVQVKQVDQPIVDAAPES